MRESFCERYRRWGVEAVLLKHTGLRVVPGADEGIQFAGPLTFRAIGPNAVELEDTYDVEISVPTGFPKALASARELGGRIPQSFHHFDDGHLCLGAPTEVLLKQLQAPSIVAFVDDLLIPYLFGYSYFKNHGCMPFGELEHGVVGLLQHFASLFGASDRHSALHFVRLAALRKRFANKWQCPCGSGRRLGRCHNQRVNTIRSLLGHKWFKQQLALIQRDVAPEP